LWEWPKPATDNGSGSPAADWIAVEFRVGVEYNSDFVIEVSPNNENSVWGSELVVEMTLSGGNPDWVLVTKVWRTLANLWSAVAWDEHSGFDVSVDAPSG